MTTGLRVRFDELDVGEEELSYFHEQPFSGVAFEESPRGVLQSEVEFENGLQHGESRVWHENGRLAEVAHYNSGVRHGPTEEWDNDARKKRETMFEYGIRTAERVFADDGAVLSEWKIGPNDNLWTTLQQLRVKYDNASE